MNENPRVASAVEGSCASSSASGAAAACCAYTIPPVIRTAPSVKPIIRANFLGVIANSPPERFRVSTPGGQASSNLFVGLFGREPAIDLAPIAYLEADLSF